MSGYDIDVGEGLTLHLERDGHGSPLLLLHGFTGSGATWDSLRATLRDRFEIITVDLPGHGRSSAPPDPVRYSLRRTADDLAHVLDAFDIGHAAALGYSMGGRAALQLALAHPARICALILEGASPGIAGVAERSARVAADEALAAAIGRDGMEAFVDRWERLPLWESQSALPAATRAGLRAERLGQRAEGLAGALRGAGAGVEPPVTERLVELSMPVLLIAGALDARYVALGRAMAERFPDARLEVVPDAGHAVHLERPDAFAALVADFLSSLPAANPRPPL